jgi:hypothetical protein
VLAKGAGCLGHYPSVADAASQVRTGRRQGLGPRRGDLGEHYDEGRFLGLRGRKLTWRMMLRSQRCIATTRGQHRGGDSLVDGGVNPRKSGDDRKSGTRFAARDQPLLAIFRSNANGCSVALCQRRQPPKAGAVGQRLQRVAGQPSLTIKSDGWLPVAAGPTDRRAALCKDNLDAGTDCAPFMRGFSPPPTSLARTLKLFATHVATPKSTSWCSTFPSFSLA